MLLLTVPLDHTTMGWTSVDWIERKEEFVMRFELGKPWVSLTGLRPRKKGINLWILVEGNCQGIERFNWAMLAQWIRAMGLLPSSLSSRFVNTVLFHPHHSTHIPESFPFIIWSHDISHIWLAKESAPALWLPCRAPPRTSSAISSGALSEENLSQSHPSGYG